MAEPALKPPPSFDTHRTVKGFADAGIDPLTAEALTEGLEIALRHTATKSDTASKADVQLLRTDMEKFQLKTEAEFKLIREEMNGIKKSIINTLGGIIAAGFAVMSVIVVLAIQILSASGAGG